MFPFNKFIQKQILIAQVLETEVHSIELILYRISICGYFLGNKKLKVPTWYNQKFIIA